MNNMIKASKDIKKKLSLNDYNMPATQEGSKSVTQHADKPVIENTSLNTNTYQDNKLANCQSVKPTCNHTSTPAKVKATYYLNPDANKQFTEVYINRLKNDKKTDRSALICEAIKLLYKNEF